jgi:cytidine deaminase
MEELKKISKVEVYANENELAESDMSLLEQARQAIAGSHAPYSKFHVGCALRMKNGKVVIGSNQENIAYPSGLCAERVAIFQAGSLYPDTAVDTMAITVKAEDYVVDKPITSCGACLQSMSEYEMKFASPIRLILQGEKGDIWIANGLHNFMPFMFYISELGA